MTSATGDLKRSAAGRALVRSTHARRAEGFTLIEILVVMAIIAFLAGLVLVATGPIFRRASKGSTKAMVDRMQTYIAEYYRKKGELPPDGYDNVVKNKDGELLQGSAALYHALSRPIVVTIEVAGEDKVIEYEPVAEFRQAELSEEDPEIPGVRYILDGFGVPFHYDNQIKRKSPPEVGDEDPGPDSPVGRWKFRGYEIWSLGWRSAAAEEWEEEQKRVEEIGEED